MELYQGPTRNKSALQPATDAGGFILMVIIIAIGIVALLS